MNFKFSISFFALLMFLSCTTSSELDSKKSFNSSSAQFGNGKPVLMSNDGSAQVSQEDQKKFIDGFLRSYKLIEGQSFLVHADVLLTITSGSSFQAKNLGTQESPELTFELNINNPSGPNSVASLNTDSSVAETFEITSATTGDFYMVIKTKSGKLIHKEMEIEILGDELLLDKVAIAKYFEVAITMESFSATGLAVGQGANAIAKASNREDNSISSYYRNKYGKETSPVYSYWRPRYPWQSTPVIVEQTPVYYSVAMDGRHLHIYLKSPLDDTRRILKNNIKSMTSVSHNGFSLEFNKFF